MTYPENIKSWVSAVHGLIILGEATPRLYIGLEPPASDVAKEFKKEDKKRLRTSRKFLKYVIKKI